MANSSLALGSSLNLKRINKSVSSLGQSVRNAQTSSANISKSLLEGNRNKRKSLSLTSTLFRRRQEATLRREREDILEAGSVVGAVRRTGKVVMNSTKGFLGRILDYVGTILVGWAILNLPKIINLAKDLTTRMQKYFGILQDFVGGVSGFLLGFGQRVGEVFTSLSGFRFDTVKDFFDKNLEKLKTSFSKLQNTVNNFVLKFKSIDTADKLLDYFNMKISDFEIPGLNKFLETLGVKKPEENGGGGRTDPGGGSTQLPDPKSAEMYRIAAALTTEGNSDQGYADMMQVVANRVASPGYGSSYTEVLGAPGQFAGVYKRGLASFKSIRSLGEASAWSGQSQATLLKVISLMTDPARQSSAASFVGGALEFRGSPATVRAVNSDNDPNNNIQADRNGIIPGTVWRGTDQDNQFITSNPPGAAYIPIRPGGAAPFNLPKAKPANSLNLKTGSSIEYTKEEIEELKKANPGMNFNFSGILPNRRGLYGSSSIAQAPTNLLVIKETVRVKQPTTRQPQQQKTFEAPIAMVNNTWDKMQFTALT